ncbi:MAG: Hsp20/alpha crystallin family protein [Ramlibacter sp.]
MFFAPAVRNNGMLAPALGTVDLGFERFMNEAFKGLGAPFHDLEEDEKSWTLTVDMPGVAKEQLSLNLEGRLVRVETSAESKRQFKGTYELPHDINPDACEARLENGVLTVKLAKREPQPTGRQIAIN